MFQRISVLREWHDKLNFISWSPLINFISTGDFFTLFRTVSYVQGNTKSKLRPLSKQSRGEKSEQVVSTIKLPSLTLKMFLNRLLPFKKYQEKTFMSQSIDPTPPSPPPPFTMSKKWSFPHHAF